MGRFMDMANGAVREELRPRHVFVVSKRRSPGTVFLQPQQLRRSYYQEIPGVPTADPESIGAIYRDASNFIKVSLG
jgi:hypothetical protein